MISKRVLIIAALLLVVSASTTMAATLVDVQQYAVAGDLKMWSNPTNGGYMDLYDAANPTAPCWALVLTSVQKDGVTASSIYAGLDDAVKTAYNGGTWTGQLAAISSSTCLANVATLKYALAVATSDEWNTITSNAAFHNVTLTPGLGLVQFTYTGDVDLTGSVNTTDLGIVKSNVIAQNQGTVLPAKDWVNGDIDYTGSVNTTDLGIIKSIVIAQNQTGTYPTINMALLPYVPSAGAAAVPEPCTLVLGLLAFVGFLGFRKFSK